MKKSPLAYRMSPKSLDDFVGQEELVGKNKLLNRMITSGKLSSIIFFGPPGTGKTTLAKIISNSTGSVFKKINAVTAGIADIKKVIEETNNHFFNQEGRTVLFIDEIHRFNKTQQDALLPYVEDGTIILIGATTENPFFEVNKALISRSTVFMLKPLTNENIITIINNVLQNKESGLGNQNITITDEALDFIANSCSGDARIAINALEIATNTTSMAIDGSINIDLSVASECIQKKVLKYDSQYEEHFDTISALIKSMRGSDPDATIFYLARAIYAGESPEYLARRIVICASEDVGMANPSALTLAVSAFEAVKMIGMPEARIILSQAAIMVATSPKSNSSYMAINKALSDVEKKNTGDIPLHLRNAVNLEQKKFGVGVSYKYPHDFENNFVKQEYMPQELKGVSYYKPSQNGYELKISEWMEKNK